MWKKSRMQSVPGALRTDPVAEKRIILAFRLQTVLVVTALLAFTNGAVLLSSVAFKVAAAYILSNVVLTAIPARYYTSLFLTGGMLIADVLFVSACIYFSGSRGGDLYLLYFLAIFMAALTRDLKTTVIVAVVISVVYLWVSASTLGLSEVASPTFLLRIPLFFVTSFFSGFLANQARLRELEQRKAKLATSQLRSQLEATQKLEEATLARYRSLYLHHRNIMASITSGIIVVDRDGRITTFNREAERITGLRAADVVGKRCAKYVGLKAIAERLDDAISTGNLARSDEAVITTAKGEAVPVGITTSLLRDQNEEVTGAIAAFRDLSDVNELRTRVQRSERLAFLGEMAASVAHEIRNPLNSISGFAQLLCERIPEEDRRHKFAEIIVDETKRIERIVAQTLHFARDENVPLEPIDFNEVINSTVAAMRDKLAANGISLLLDLNPYLPYIEGNDVALRQVCTNLLTNAIHALGEGGQITVTTTSEGGTVSAVFEDDGPGVPADLREKIFHPFFTTKTNGTGLGLAVSQKIIADHKGLLRLVDKPGKGAVFEIVLPVYESEENPENYLTVSSNARGAE